MAACQVLMQLQQQSVCAQAPAHWCPPAPGLQPLPWQTSLQPLARSCRLQSLESGKLHVHTCSSRTAGHSRPKTLNLQLNLTCPLRQ